MGEFPQLHSAVQTIDCLTRDDTELGARAFKLWQKLHDHDAAACVRLARREREVGLTIEGVKYRVCSIVKTAKNVCIIKYSDGTREVSCEYLKDNEKCNYAQNENNECSWKK